MLTHPKLSLVIPCFNEADNLRTLCLRISEKLNHRDDIEILLINNGSTDASRLVLLHLQQEFPFIKPLEILQNKGYGYGIFWGLQQAKGEFVGWTHADLQTDPVDCLHALELIEKESVPEQTFVKGVRVCRPLTDQLFASAMGLFATTLFAIKMVDINAQPSVFHNSFLETWHEPPTDFSFDLYAYLLALKNGYKVKRFKVNFPKRKFGNSSWNSSAASCLQLSWKTIRYSLQLRFKMAKWKS